MLKYILSLLLFSLFVIFSGCSSIPVPTKETSYFPQMQTQAQVLTANQIPNVDLLGAYTDGQGWIYFLGYEGKCYALLTCDCHETQEISCQEGYDIYRETCKKVGNCT
jgi:hypothetical protein